MPRVFIKVKQVIIPPSYVFKKSKFSLTCIINTGLDREEMDCEVNGNVLTTKQIFSMTVKEVKKSIIRIALNEQASIVGKTLGTLNLHLKWFTKETVVIDWFPMKSKFSEQSFMFQCQVHITSDPNKRPFQAFTSELTYHQTGWEEPFINLQPNNDLYTIPPEQIDEENGIQVITQHSAEDTSESSFQNSIPQIYMTDKPLISLKNEKTRPIELF